MLFAIYDYIFRYRLWLNGHLLWGCDVSFNKKIWMSKWAMPHNLIINMVKVKNGIDIKKRYCKNEHSEISDREENQCRSNPCLYTLCQLSWILIVTVLLPVCQSVNLSVNTPLSLSVGLLLSFDAFRSAILLCQLACQSVCQPGCLSVGLSICWPVSLLPCLSVFVIVSVTGFLSICQSICPYVCRLYDCQQAWILMETVVARQWNTKQKVTPVSN